MPSRSLYYLPLAYTYRTRLGNYRAALGFVTRDILPLALPSIFVYRVPLRLVVLLFVGFFSFYECGYLWNDLADSAKEPGGDRLPDKGLRPNVFVFIRTALIGVVSILVYRTKGIDSMACFDLAGIAMVFLLVLHTSRGVRKVRFLRLITFAALAFYRFLPALLPVLSWDVTRELLVAAFMGWGFARVLIYALRKHGDTDAVAYCETSHPILQAASIVVFAPLFLTVSNIRNWQECGPLITWVTLVVGQIVLFALHFLRRMIKVEVQTVWSVGSR